MAAPSASVPAMPSMCGALQMTASRRKAMCHALSIGPSASVTTTLTSANASGLWRQTAAVPCARAVGSAQSVSAAPAAAMPA